MPVDGGDHLRRALEFLHHLAVDRSTSVVPVPGGHAVLNSRFPAAHNLNRLIVTEACTAKELAAAADSVLGAGGMDHRLIDVLDSGLARMLAPGLAEAGYLPSPELVMAATGPSRRPPAPAEPGVVRLGVVERAAVASADWRAERPDWDETVIDQLGQRIGTVLSAAEACFLAVRNRNGRVVARADLYLRDGVAQVEEVMTDPVYQRRGLASRLVWHAVEQARSAGADPIFLVADEDDWPQELYRRLGFTDLGTTVSFSLAS